MTHEQRQRRATAAAQEICREDESVVVVICDMAGNFTVAGTHPGGQDGIARLLAAAADRTASGTGQFQPRIPRKIS